MRKSRDKSYPGNWQTTESVTGVGSELEAYVPIPDAISFLQHRDLPEDFFRTRPAKGGSGTGDFKAPIPTRNLSCLTS